MTRTRFTLALTTSFACTVGPHFVGETAESSTGGAEAADDAGDDQSETGATADDASGGTPGDDGDSAADTGGEILWPVELDGHPRQLDIAGDGSPRVVFAADPGERAEIQTFTTNGEPGPRMPIGESTDGAVLDFVHDDAGAALLIDTELGYEVQVLSADLTETSWTRERVVDETGEHHLRPLELGRAPGGGFAIAGLIDTTIYRPFVHAYDANGDEVFSFPEASSPEIFPGYTILVVGLLEDEDNVLLRMQLWDDEYVDDHVAHFGHDGTIVENESFLSASLATLTPMRRTGGWATVGGISPEGGLRFEFFDDHFQAPTVVDDPGIGPDSRKYPAESRTTPSGFAVLMFHYDDPDSYLFEVRSYDHAGALLGSTLLEDTSSPLAAEYAELEVAADGTIYVVTDRPPLDPDPTHVALLYRVAH